MFKRTAYSRWPGLAFSLVALRAIEARRVLELVVVRR